MSKNSIGNANSEDSTEAKLAVWQLLMDLMRLNLEATNDELEALGLTPASANLLRILEPGQLLPMAVIAKALRCHDSNVTGLIDRLERKNLVVRQLSPEDRRVKMIALTPIGVELRLEMLKKIGEPPPFLKSLEKTDCEKLQAILQKAAQNIDKP